MSKPIRYKDGTLMMPGSDAHELATAGKTKELDKHMKELDEKWRKMEGRPAKGQPEPCHCAM